MDKNKQMANDIMIAGFKIKSIDPALLSFPPFEEERAYIVKEFLNFKITWRDKLRYTCKAEEVKNNPKLVGYRAKFTTANEYMLAHHGVFMESKNPVLTMEDSEKMIEVAKYYRHILRNAICRFLEPSGISLTTKGCDIWLYEIFISAFPELVDSPLKINNY